MLKLHLEPLVPSEVVRERAYFRWQQSPDVAAEEHWAAATADEVIAKVKHAIAPLPGNINAAVCRLYREASLSGIDWPRLWQDTDGFLDAYGGSAAFVTDFFRNLTGVAAALMQSGRYFVADQFWYEVFQGIRLWERSRNRLIHKGAGLYFWGLNQVLSGDLLRGFTLIHESFQEDLREYGGPLPSTPAAAFVTLDHDHSASPDLARFWILKVAGTLSQDLGNLPSAMPLASFRTRLIASSTDISRVFLFVYSQAILDRLNDQRPYCESNPFLAQLAIDGLFNMLTVVERTIGDWRAASTKNTEDRKDTFGGQAMYLSKQYGGTLTSLSAANKAFRADSGLTIQSLLDASRLPGAVAISRVDADITLAYLLRNFGGHDPRPLPILWDRLDDIRGRVIHVLSLVI